MVADQKFKAYQEELAKLRAESSRKEIEAKEKMEKLIENQKVVSFALTDEMQQLERKKDKELKHAEEIYRQQMLEKSEAHIKELSGYKLKIADMEKTMSERGISWNQQFKELDSRYRDEIKRLRIELQDNRKQIKDYEDKLGARESLMHDLKNDLTMKLNLIGNLEDQIAAGNQSEESLRKKIKDMQKTFDDFERQKLELHEVIVSLKSQSEKQVLQIDSLKTAISLHER